MAKVVSANVEPQEVQEDDSWGHPFSREQVASWKKQYGQIYLIEDKAGNPYVMRGLGREEYSVIAAGTYRNEQDYENHFAQTAILYPEYSELQIRQVDGGIVKTLYDRIAGFSNSGIADSIEVVEFNPEVHGPKLEGTTAVDWKAWQAAARGRKLFFCEMEDKFFVYRNLNRSQYENYRIKIAAAGVDQEGAEHTVCREAVIYPMPDKFSPATNKYLYGTISTLAFLIMKQSGFGEAVRVTKL